MWTEQIAEMINPNDCISVRMDKVYAVIGRFPDVFVKAEGRIMLMI